MIDHPAARFLHLLLGDADVVASFQIIPDTPLSTVRTRVIRGRFSEVREALERLNAKGAGIFLVMNETRGESRKKSDVTAVRTLFVDGDHIHTPTAWRVLPTLVQRRGAKWHAFWRLISGESVARWERAMQALAAVYGSDRAVCELARVMRLPGFLHWKDPFDPTAYIVSHSEPSAFSIDDVLSGHGIDPATVTEEAPAPAVAVPLDSHEITSAERDTLMAALRATKPSSRHDTALFWAVDAVAAGMPDTEIHEALEAWFAEHGREPQPREIANAIRDARAGLTSGRMAPRLAGVRLDLQFPALPEGPAAIVPPLAPEAAQAQAAELIPWEARIARNKDGSWKSHVRNVELVLMHDERVGTCFRFNLFTLAVEVTRPPWRGWVGTADWCDDDAVAFAQWIAANHQGCPAINPDVIRAAVRPFARRHAFHPIRDYLDALRWDNVPRIDTWAHRYLGAAATPYHAAVGARFLIGAVARIVDPGCKLDTMLVLEGAQGTFKSSALRTLFSPWFIDPALDVGNKDASAILRGNWCVEFPEMHAARRAAVTELKAFITRQSDRQRDAYAHVPETVARQCIFAGTTNNDEYLRDETGGRRFWPLVCGRVDLVGLAEAKDQLWAEAAARQSAGEAWWLSGEQEQLAQAVQAQRLVHDEWCDVISEWLGHQTQASDLVVSPRDQVTGLEVWTGALGGSAGTFLRPTQTRLAECMRVIGYARCTFRRNGHKIKGYRRPTSVPVGSNNDALG